MAGLALGSFGTAAWADQLSCRLFVECAEGHTCRSAPLDIAFGIDRTQFAAPMHRSDPPRKLVTQVRAGAETFKAEPILMSDGTRGFHAELPDRERLLTITLDGAAIYTDTAEKHRRTGTCKGTIE